MDFADIGVKAAIIWINTDGYSMMDGHLAIKKSMIFHSHWKHHLWNFHVAQKVVTGRHEFRRKIISPTVPSRFHWFGTLRLTKRPLEHWQHHRRHRRRCHWYVAKHQLSVISYWISNQSTAPYSITHIWAPLCQVCDICVRHFRRSFILPRIKRPKRKFSFCRANCCVIIRAKCSMQTLSLLW